MSMSAHDTAQFFDRLDSLKNGCIHDQLEELPFDNETLLEILNDESRETWKSTIGQSHTMGDMEGIAIPIGSDGTGGPNMEELISKMAAVVPLMDLANNPAKEPAWDMLRMIIIEASLKGFLAGYAAGSSKTKDDRLGVESAFGAIVESYQEES